MHVAAIVGWGCVFGGVLAIGTMQLRLLRGRLQYSPAVVVAEVLAALLSTVGLMLAMQF